MAPKHSKQSRLRSKKTVLKRPACAPSSSAQGGTAQPGTPQPEHSLGDQADGPNTMDYRAFKLALQSPQAQENGVAHLAQAVKDLKHYSNKRQMFAELVMAYKNKGFAHPLFKTHHLLSTVKEAQQKQHVVPRAVMLGTCGGKEAFLEGLRNGDIEEVVHPEDPGKLLYKYKSFSESCTVRKAQVAKSTGHSAEEDPLAQLDFSWALQGTGAQSSAQLALEQEAAQKPLPLEDASAAQRVLLRVEDAVRAGAAALFKSKKALAVLGTTAIAQDVKGKMQDSLQVFGNLHSGLEQLALSWPKHV